MPYAIQQFCSRMWSYSIFVIGPCCCFNWIFTIRGKFLGNPIINVSDGNRNGFNLVNDINTKNVCKISVLQFFVGVIKSQNFCWFSDEVPYFFNVIYRWWIIHPATIRNSPSKYYCLICFSKPPKLFYFLLA